LIWPAILATTPRAFADAVHIRRYWFGTQLSMEVGEAEPDGEELEPHHDADLLQR
jgi:hypothetical protein